MTPELLHHPDPAQLSSVTSTAEILAAVRQFGADGSLEIQIDHERPANAANWLPSPAGRFYLILRMYYPRDGVQSWRIPALQAQAVHA